MQINTWDYRVASYGSVGKTEKEGLEILKEEMHSNEKQRKWRR